MVTNRLIQRPLGRTGLMITPIGFGAFKLGRNLNIKYDRSYALPTDDESAKLLCAAVDELGMNYVDTAPAYGLSEQRVGVALGGRRNVVISTKVGETFTDGHSHFDFSRQAVCRSLANSRRALRRNVLDVVFIHSHGDDRQILDQTDIVSTLQQLKADGDIRAIGFSGKTIDGARSAISWADVIMVEYHLNDPSHEQVIAEAAVRGVGVVVKKGLASGRLSPSESIRFVLGNPGVTSMVIGGLNIEHMRQNVAACPPSLLSTV